MCLHVSACLYVCVWGEGYKKKTFREIVYGNVPLIAPTTPLLVSGKRRGTQGEFCSAGDDGRPGSGA